MNDPVEFESTALSSDRRASGFLANLWRDLREAVLSSPQDFTEGGIGRAILLLAIPMVLEMSMESVFGIVDVYFVARLGAEAIATVGLTESLLTLIFAVAMGLSMATTALVARRIGEKDPADASVAAAQAIIVGAVASWPVALVGFLFTPIGDFLRRATVFTTRVGSPDNPLSEMF